MYKTCIRSTSGLFIFRIRISFTTPVVPTVFTVLWCAGTVWSMSTVYCVCSPPQVDGQNPAPPHHFMEGSHSNPRAPSFNVGETPLRRWRRRVLYRLTFHSLKKRPISYLSMQHPFFNAGQRRAKMYKTCIRSTSGLFIFIRI